MEGCVFCSIVLKDKAAEVVFEDDQFIAFKDINPKAPQHVLVVPRKHIESLEHVETADAGLMGNLVITAQNVARAMGISKTGYKIVINVGKGGGQEIDHLHLHILGGW